MSFACRVQRPGPENRVETLVRGDLMFLPLEVNGRAGLFLVDTGAGISLIDINQAKKYGFKYFVGANEGRLDGIGGAQHVVPLGSLTVCYATDPLEGLRFYGADLAGLNLYFEKRSMRVLGIIGADFLRKKHAVIDFENREIQLSERRWPTSLSKDVF